MRKQLFLILTISAIFSLLVFSQIQAAASITVYFPSEGMILIQGSTYNISWNYQEITNPVDIYLYKGVGVDRTIALNEPCDGIYAWQVPAGLPTGSDYQIVILGTGSNIWDIDHSDTFSITGTALAPSGVPHINSLNPTSGSSNTLITITGTNFNPDSSHNRILIKGEGQYAPEEPYAPQEASATQLKINAPYLSAGYYTIRVESFTQNNEWITSDNSASFTLATSCPYSPTGVCECIPITLMEGGCGLPGKCSSDCAGSFAGKACSSDADCTQAGQCNSPNQCAPAGQSCTSFTGNWYGVGGVCPNGRTCCAQSGGSVVPSTGTIQNPLGPGMDSFDDLVNTIIMFLIKISIPIATVMFVISGVVFVTSVGDPGKAKTAKNIMIYTAVGLVVILVASGLIKVIQSLLGGSVVPSTGTIQNPLAYGKFEDLVNAIIGFLIKIGIPIASVMFVIAGVVFVTSSGDPNKVKTAKNIMIYTAVGLAVILVASGLIKVLQSLLGGS